MNESFLNDDRTTSPIGGVIASVWGVLLVLCQAAPWIKEHLSNVGRLVFIVAGMLFLVWGVRRLTTSWVSKRFDRFARWNRHRMAITREGIAYVAIMSVMFLGSIVGRTNMLMFVFAMMIGPWVLNGWIAFSMLRRAQAKRSQPHRAVVDEMISVEIEVTNNKWLLGSWLLAARDRIRHHREHLQGEILFVRIPAGQSRRGHYFVRLSQRGQYSFGPIELKTHFPLGLIERGLVCNDFSTLIVHPRVGRMTSRWRSDLWNAAELAERRRMRAGLFDDEFHRIREYRPGDNPKAIHWRTTARRGELMVREFQQTRDRELILLVELWQPASATSASFDRIELAISFAATVLHENLRQSRESRLQMRVVGADQFSWDHLSSLEQALDHLALASASASADVRPVVDETMQRISNTARVVVISSRPRNELHARMRGVAEVVESLWLSAEARDLSPYFVLEGMA